MNLKSSELENSQFEKYVIGMKRVILILGISAALLLLFSCDEQLFTEYDGQSFLSTTSLQTDSWELMPDYSFVSGTSSTDYMDFSLDSSTGGPNGGPSYRLEIKNLLKNGDFETGSTTEPWFLYNSSTKVIDTGDIPGTLEIINSGSYEIDNKTVRINLSTNERAKIVFTDALINSNTYAPNKSYFFKYDYRTGSPLNIFYIPQWDSSTTEPDLGDFYYFQSFGGIGGSSDLQDISIRNTYPPLDPTVTESRSPNRITASGYDVLLNTDSLTFAGSSQGGSYDNMRIIRSPEGEFDLKLRLKMNQDHRTDLQLISGYYRFSVWVKEADLSAVNNCFHADRIELGIQGYDSENQLNVEDYQVFYETQLLSDLYSLRDGGSYSGDWSSGWTQLILASEKNIQLPDISEETIMELTISPSNPGITDNSWNRLSAGSILISEPVLEYSSTPW